MCVSCEGLINAINAYIDKADGELADELKRAGFLATKETVKRIEALEDKLVSVLLEQSEDFAKMLAAAEDRGENLSDVLGKYWQKFKAGDKLRDRIFPIIFDELSEYIPKLSTVYMSEMDSELTAEHISRKTTEWTAQWSYELSELMHLSSHEELEGILIHGLKGGKGVAEVARDILENDIRDEYYKARRVSLTEMLRAHSVAREEAIQQCPAAQSKEWVHTGGHRIKPRKNHIAMNGQIVSKNECFKLRGADGVVYLADYPRDPFLPATESVNCHCIHRAIVSEEILGLSLEDRKRLQQQAIEETDAEWEKELDSESKAKAGINEGTVKCEWLKAKSAAERKKYFRSDSRFALFESGVIQTDEELEKLYKTVNTSKGERKVFKSLTELKDDGIITVSDKALRHSTVGDFTSTNRLVNGGHGQSGMTKLINIGTEPVIYKEYSNGVRIGSVPNHKNKYKQIGSNKPNSDIGQSWFPKDWSDDKILLSGTYAANKGVGTEIVKSAIYDGVEVVVFVNDGQIGTICPNNMKQPKGDEWEYARD